LRKVGKGRTKRRFPTEEKGSGAGEQREKKFWRDRRLKRARKKGENLQEKNTGFIANVWSQSYPRSANEIAPPLKVQRRDP